MKVIYPVCIFEEKNGYTAFIKDLNNSATCGDTLEETIYMVQDLIAGYILENLTDIKDNVIPKSSNIEDINIEEIEKHLEIESNNKRKFKTLVIVDLEEFTKKWSKKSVKKTLSIPSWLNEKAEKKGVNFSKVLQDALLQKIL